ncbi:MAG: hypothetical protein EA365_09010 [Gloeocapsa sp. DLM2.Bin57]|jgi:hypothetical protein|nr:MAG: hypothetical protein EA365_09010 [Gloeocapsa sp. DLM2.Bin57]
MLKHQLTTALVAMSLTIAPLSVIQAETIAVNNRDVYQAQIYNNVVPSGTVIPLESLDTEKILLLPGESMTITLQVAQDIRNNQGRVVIPRGTEVSGRLEPDGNGTRFIAEYLYLRDGNSYSIDGVSRVVTRREIVEQGANNRAILQGAVIGASAATLIAGITGDKKIRAPEVLGGAGLGALIGYAFRGGQRSQELISINPNTDLDITLRTDFYE